jgi:hypothetical protein
LDLEARGAVLESPMPVINCPHCNKAVQASLDEHKEIICPSCARPFVGGGHGDDGEGSSGQLDRFSDADRQVIRSGAVLLQVCAGFYGLTMLVAVLGIGLGAYVEGSRAHSMSGVIMGYLCLSFIVLITLTAPLALMLWAVQYLRRGQASAVIAFASIVSGLIGCLLAMTAIAGGLASVAGADVLNGTKANIYTSLGLLYFFVMATCLLIGAVRGIRAGMVVNQS